MRSISQIYSEIVTTRNNYLQLTELNSGRSNSKLSMLNLISYVMAVCIHTYEAVLDAFQVKMAQVLAGRINGTPDWYVRMAKKFQYNAVTGMGDVLKFNEDTLKIEYETPDLTHRIIEQAAWQDGEDGHSIKLKVCKKNTKSEEIDSGLPYMPLTDYELTAFIQFIQQIKFVGANVYSESFPGDILTVIADEENPIFYDDTYITAAQALTNIQKAMVSFVSSMEFNGMLYCQAVLDVIRKTEHIVDVSNGVKVEMTTFNEIKEQYDSPVELKSRTRLVSGYVRLLDTDSVMTINSNNITLVPASKMDEYTKLPDKGTEGKA